VLALSATAYLFVGKRIDRFTVGSATKLLTDMAD
jgi:hypothetical protein